ncbi:unnamed protein product [Rhizoctonia solani]|uniref:Uncharacterized protein n=1 Tax=Rhizoctonia solani TaxID=456999 RepID=A0A8H3DK46_9AGAM|nr:unnamed protein product [Rhizoctonia solani]
MMSSTRTFTWTWILYVLIALIFSAAPVSGPNSFGQRGERRPLLAAPTSSTRVYVATRTVTPIPIKHVPKAVESLSQTALVSIRESPASSYILPSQRPAQRPTRLWCEVCRVVRNLKPVSILRPLARSVISWAEHWYGIRTATLTNSVPPSPLPSPPPPPPPTATIPEDLPGTKTIDRQTPTSATPGGCAKPTRMANYGFTYPVPSSASIIFMFASMVVASTLVTLRSFCRTICSDSPSITVLTPATLSSPLPSALLTSPSLSSHSPQSSPSDQTPLPAYSLCLPSSPSSPAIDFDFDVTPRPTISTRRREVPFFSYGTLPKLFDLYTRMTVVQTDVTAYQVVPGHARRVVFETSTDSFPPEFQLFSEAEQRTIEALKAAQKMVQAMYVQGLEGTMEVDVRVVMEGLEVDEEDEDGVKSVKGIDRYTYRFCFVIDLPAQSAHFDPPAQTQPPVGLLPPVDIVSSSEAGSIQYWPPTNPAPKTTNVSTPKANDAELSAYGEFFQQPRVPVQLGYPLKRKRSAETGEATWLNAHRMRQRLAYRETIVDGGPDAKRRRLDGVEAGA